jgi:hypothetical protein
MMWAYVPRPPKALLTGWLPIFHIIPPPGALHNCSMTLGARAEVWTVFTDARGSRVLRTSGNLATQLCRIYRRFIRNSLASV